MSKARSIFLMDFLSNKHRTNRSMFTLGPIRRNFLSRDSIPLIKLMKYKHHGLV